MLYAERERPEQGTQLVDKSIEQNPKHIGHIANLLGNGKKQEAIASANKSIELAKEAKNDDYVALNEKLLATLK